MLRPHHRLRRSADLKRIRQEGKSRRHPLLVLLVQPNGGAFSRFGFVASRRVGGAVVRNRVKRRLREIIRSNLPCMAPGWDCLLIVRTGAAAASFAELESAVLHLFRRADLILPDRAPKAKGRAPGEADA